MDRNTNEPVEHRIHAEINSMVLDRNINKLVRHHTHIWQAMEKE